MFSTKKLGCLIVALLLTNSGVWAKSYVDAQLKQVKHNVKYNSVKIHKKSYDTSDDYVYKQKVEIKDPKLITLSEFKLISDKDYEAKLVKDEEIYKTKIIPAITKKSTSVNIEPYSVDFYNLYRISEKLIRANNLDYINWRISVRKTPDFNAAGGIGNYIEINTGLYDSLYTNEDAMAFILAHEMSHIILGHSTRRAELEKKLDRFIKVAGKSDVAKFADNVGVAVVAKQLRNLEFMADTEAIILLSKAGYDPNKALSALNFMNAFGNIRTYWSDHPITRERVESYQQNIRLSDPNWVNIGRENIYNSEVLNAKKSSDRVTLVLDKAQNVTKFYEVENLETRLTRVAYMSYLNGDFKNAVKYFEQLSAINEGNYVPYVYLALANSALYNKNSKSSYLTQALKAITKAKDLEPENTVVNNYYNDLNKQNSL